MGSFWVDDSEEKMLGLGRTLGVYMRIRTQDGHPQSFFLTCQLALLGSNRDIVLTMCRAEKAKLFDNAILSMWALISGRLVCAEHEQYAVRLETIERR